MRAHNCDGQNDHHRTRPTATTCTTTQTALERAGALTFPTSCLDGSVTRLGPGRYSHYTRADFGPEAVGSSNHKHIKSPNVKPYGTVKSRKFAQTKSVRNHFGRSSMLLLKPLSRSRLFAVAHIQACTFTACASLTPKTCKHVRHLGPCFKTGRTRPRCQERTSRIEQQLWSVNSKTWRLNAVHMSILRCVNAHRK